MLPCHCALLISDISEDQNYDATIWHGYYILMSTCSINILFVNNNNYKPIGQLPVDYTMEQMRSSSRDRERCVCQGSVTCTHDVVTKFQS